MKTIYHITIFSFLMISCLGESTDSKLTHPIKSICETEPIKPIETKENQEPNLDTTLHTELKQALLTPLKVTRLSLTRQNSKEKQNLINSSIHQFKNLKELRITNSSLKSLPESIGELSNLETLILNDNFELQGLPESFSQLKSLKHLDLSLCFMNHFPKPIYEMRNLEYLNLMKTGISTIPSEIRNLKNLKTLYLNNNPLKRIPKELGELTNLEKLWLFNIKTSTIPDSFSNLKNLKYLAIYGSPEYLNRISKMLPQTKIGAGPG